MTKMAESICVHTVVLSHMPRPLLASAAGLGSSNGNKLRAEGAPTPDRAGGSLAAACDRESRSTTPAREAGEARVRREAHGSGIAVHRH